MIRIVGTVKSNLRDDIKSNLVPIVRLGEELALQIQQRVHVAGLAGDGGAWSTYKAKRKPPGPGVRFYWTKIGEPAPDMHRIVTATQGKYAGRSAYPSYLHWRESMVAARPKLFVLTGELRDSIEVVAPTPTRVEVRYNNKLRAAPYGRAKSGKPYSNQKVAQFAFRTERMSPMQLSPAELAYAQRFMQTEVPAQVLKDLRLAGLEVAAVAGANRVNRRVNSLLSGGGVRTR